MNYSINNMLQMCYIAIQGNYPISKQEKQRLEVILELSENRLPIPKYDTVFLFNLVKRIKIIDQKKVKDEKEKKNKS